MIDYYETISQSFIRIDKEYIRNVLTFM